MTGKYVFNNPLPRKPEDRSIADGFRRITSDPALDADSFSPPATMGKGKCARLISKDSYDIYRYELQVKRSVLLSAGTEGPVYALQFCMGSDVEWQEKESGIQLRLEQGQGAFSFINRISKTCEYQAGQQYKAFLLLSRPGTALLAEPLWAEPWLGI
jgi:hypothetical protein